MQVVAKMYKDNEYHDSDRYDSAADRKEDQKQKKLHDELKRKDPELYCSTGALQSYQVNDWLREIKPAYRAEYLFGDLWRPGEVTVLAGETGVGKSILAVQIAESIARGKMPFREPQHEIQFGPTVPPMSKLFPPPRRQRILYFDLETSPAKMSERYSCPSPILGKLPVRYRFASWFERSGYVENIKVPDHFRGDLARFLRHSVDLAIRWSEAKVIIIDDLAALEPAAPRSNGPARWLRRFRHYAAVSGLSFLILTHLRSSPPYQGGVAAALGGRGRSLRPVSLTDISLGRQIAELADTVIAIGKTTYGPEYRYLKVLKSKNLAPNSPPYQGGVAALGGRGGSLRPLSLSDLSLGRQIAELSDTVIAIGKTTYGPEYRYLKVLKSKNLAPNSPPYQGGVAAALGGRGGSLGPEVVLPNVLAFQIQRTTGFSEDRPRRRRVSGCGPTATLDGSAARTPHVSKGSVPATENTEPTELSKFVTPVSPSPFLSHSPSPLLPHSPTPFLGFTYLGPAAEHDLIRDHTAEALKAQREHERELKKLQKRNTKDILAEAIIDGSYARYLKGE